MKTINETSTILPLQLSEETRTAAVAVLERGETLSDFVLKAIQLHIQHRAMQREFTARGLAARDEVLTGLDRTLGLYPKYWMVFDEGDRAAQFRRLRCVCGQSELAARRNLAMKMPNA